jgi:hypothetical protein
VRRAARSKSEAGQATPLLGSVRPARDTPGSKHFRRVKASWHFMTK